MEELTKTRKRRKKGYILYLLKKSQNLTLYCCDKVAVGLLSFYYVEERICIVILDIILKMAGNYLADSLDQFMVNQQEQSET